MSLLRAQDIQRQQFASTIRGYDPREVDTFLERVQKYFQQLEDELAGRRDTEPRWNEPVVSMTSQAIRDQTFRRSFRGYKPEAVDTFLSRLADDLEALEAEAGSA